MSAHHALRIIDKANRAVDAINLNVALLAEGDPAITADTLDAVRRALAGEVGPALKRHWWNQVAEWHDEIHPEMAPASFDTSRPVIVDLLAKASATADPFVGLTA